MMIHETRPILPSPVTDALQRVAQQEGIDSVYLSGSLYAGLGTSTSDIDVFCLTSDSWPGTGESRQLLEGGDRIDFEFYPFEYVEELVERFTSWTTTREDLSALRPSDKEFDIVVRLLYAETVQSSSRFDELRKKARCNEDAIRQVLIARWTWLTSAQLEDFTGAWDGEDWDSAALVAHDIVITVGKAVAAAAGDLYYGRKWVFRQLARSTSEGGFSLDKFRFMLRAEWISEGEAGRQRFLDFILTSVLASQLVGWDKPNLNDWKDWDPVQMPFERNRSYWPLRLTKGFLLYNERVHQLLLSPAAVQVWALPNTGLGDLDSLSGSEVDSARQSSIRERLLSGQLLVSRTA